MAAAAHTLNHATVADTQPRIDAVAADMKAERARALIGVVATTLLLLSTAQAYPSYWVVSRIDCERGL